MTTSALVVGRRRDALLAKPLDYAALTKPRIIVLELVVVVVAALLSGWDPTEPRILAFTLAGTALVAGSASALNQWLERERDKLMDRTSDRPLAAGRLSEAEGLCFGILLAVGGFVLLLANVNGSTAFAALAAWSTYVWVYTPLKSKTTMNTSVGALAGALPVLIGAASTGEPMTLTIAALFLTVFLWQYPHFMAIAWLYRDQYARAGAKMLSVVDSTGHRAGRQATLGALALLPVSLLPPLFWMKGGWAAGMTLALALWQLYFAIRFFHSANDTSARRLMRISLVYLPAQMIVFALLPL